ncbi:MAG: hypothetical protein COU08_00090, partial [Candidatus Harrisonbacteria bacterium CG10_big_fil_rev_8_21_14_0_10_42_17]
PTPPFLFARLLELRGRTGVEFYQHKLLAYKICSIINLWKFTAVKIGAIQPRKAFFARPELRLSLSLSRKREEFFSPIYLLPLQVSVAEFCVLSHQRSMRINY